jgi:hypothetical protein
MLLNLYATGGIEDAASGGADTKPSTTKDTRYTKEKPSTKAFVILCAVCG